MSEPPPPSGHEAPPPGGVPPGDRFYDPSDPLISPDYAGWRRRNIAILKAYWRPLVVLQLIGAAAALVLRVPTAVAQEIGTRGLPTTAPSTNADVLRALGRALPWVILGAAGWILSTLVTTLVLLAGVRLIVKAVTGERPDVGDALRGALRRLFPLIGWGLLAGLITLVGFCACFLPGLYFAAVFTVLPAVVLFERGDVIARCFRLFHTDLAASVARVGTIIAIGIAAGLISGIIDSAVRGAVHALSGGTGGTGEAVVSTAIVTVVDVMIAAGFGVLLGPLILTTYADLRARREPLRTDVLARDLER
jgi:hypothetical protein